MAAIVAADIDEPSDPKIYPTSRGKLLQAEEYRKIFNRVDKNQDGKIDKNEFWKDGGNGAHRKAFGKNFDLDGDGTIDIHEFPYFYDVISKKSHVEHKDVALSVMFDKIDTDNDGSLSLDEMMN